jgi:hypothetical protein
MFNNLKARSVIVFNNQTQSITHQNNNFKPKRKIFAAYEEKLNSLGIGRKNGADDETNYLIVNEMKPTYRDQQAIH